MGVDTQIYLPNSARLDDITKVIGILVGLKKEKSEFENQGRQCWSVRVPEARTQGYIDIPTMARITLGSNKFKAEYCNCHFEPDRQEAFNTTGYKLLMPRSRSIWLAAGKCLVVFFGGKIIYQDCGDQAIDFEWDERPDNNAGDGDEWQGLQQRVWNVQPLTKVDVKAMARLAAYDE